jgi:GNAT superfamily N-acetyltransferase
MSYTIRPARPDDLETLVAFSLQEAIEAQHRELEEATVREGMRTGLENPETARYWVLEAAEAGPIGSVSIFREWSDWHNGFYIWIQTMFILPAYRGQGLMHLLLEAVFEYTRDQHAVELRLYVHEDNKNAIRAYRRTGFTDTNYRMMAMDL